MARKIIKIGVDAREGLTIGARKLSDAVGRTIGPFGENFYLDKGNTVTNDGVTVARAIELTNEIENRGATAIREAAIKTVDEVGDGTSTAIVLAYAIYDEASRYLSDATTKGKKSGSELVRQIETERKEITEKLVAMATPIDTKEQLIASALVAVEDKELATLIGGSQWDLGKDGYLLAEETAERASSVEKVNGIRIDNGFGTSQIINNQEKQMLEVEDTRILLTSYTIKDVKDWQHIMAIFDQVAKDGSLTLTVIARAWTDETIAYCLQNIQKGAKIYPLSAPYTDMQERFKDLAAVLGAKFYDSENSRLKDLVLSDLGFAKKVSARRFDAIITGKDDAWTKDRIATRVKELEDKRTGSQSDFEKKQLNERISQLKNGFAIIKVGSPSDMERKRLYDKAEDAVNAVRAALQEGTVKGAGLAFKEIADQLPDTYLLKRPLQEVYKQIMSLAPSDFVVEEFVRDPVKVLRVALEKACAAAASFATAGGVITVEFPKPLDELLKRGI
jgi:chaperonin GroEL